MIYNKFIPPFLYDLLQKFKAKKKTDYQIGNFTISIPPNFALPKYQSTLKLYDRFLPVLASKLNSNSGLIVDIGANIGDTTIAMLQHCKNPFLCVEPSQVFLPYLEENLNRLPSEEVKRISVVKKLIGTGSLSGELVYNGLGTATVNILDGTNSNTHTRLDDIISNALKVILLKVDTDGFDFDVLKSAEKTLRSDEPILYWENEISEDFQFSGFAELYSLLTQLGYRYIYVFDNFGNLMLEESSFEAVKNINTYIYSMKKKVCTRTIYYTDILAVTEKRHNVVKQAIEEYKTSWINK